MALRRHCAGSLSAVCVAAASVLSGMERVIVAGGVMATSMMPKMTYRIPGTDQVKEFWMPPTHPDSPEAPNADMSITVGWTTAQDAGISREEMDAWAQIGRAHV